MAVFQLVRCMVVPVREGAVFTNGNYNPNKDLLTPSAATNAFLVSSSYIHRTSHSNVTADETDGSIV